MAVEEVKRKGSKVKEALIESKDQRWHCRNRVTLVFGSNEIEDLDTYIYTKDSLEFKTVKFHQAKSKAIEEILDNSIDEFYRGHVTEIHVDLSADGKVVSVQDNGIGFPLAKIPDVYTEFRTGSKFKDEEVDEKGFLYRTLGQNGLGASATCLTSDIFKATVRHYNSKKEQTYEFEDGALKIKKTKEKPFKGPSGVRVELTLAKEVYKNQVVDKELLRKRIIDLAYNNPGLTFYFNDEKYMYKKGLFELAQRIDPNSAQLFGNEVFEYETTNIKGAKVKAKYDMHLSLCFDRKYDDKEKMISFVNSTPTYDGGFHHDRIKRLFINSVKDKLERTAKKDKLTLVDNDVLAGFTFVIGIVMPKLAKKGKKQRVEKLLDANERKDRTKCALFICEGDSAIGGLRSARDKLYQGGIALKGKPMNVSQASIKEVLENQEFADIMSSIGLAIGQKAAPEDLRFTKIVFLADSDVDGGHINTLLTNFFFTFWPEMFEQGMIQIAKAPLFEVITDKGTIYCESPDELEQLKNRKDIKIREIMRNKGLGEMSQEAFKHVLSRKSFTKISVKDMPASKSMLETCFGKESQLRKDLLIDSEEIDVDLTNIIAGKKADKKKAAREARA